MSEADFNTGRLIKYILPAIIFLSLIFAYWPVYQKISIHWSSGDSNYCYLVIPLFIYLLWDRRIKSAQRQSADELELKAKNQCTVYTVYTDELKQDEIKNLDGSAAKLGEEVESSEKYGFKFGEFSWNIFGIVPVLLSIVLILIGEVGSVETLMYIGIWGCVVGIVFTLYGWRIRYLVFPLVILAFIVPLPPFVNRMLTFQLKLAASSLAALMLRGTGFSVFQDGNIIDLGVSQLQVVDACSGLRYLMPLILIALLVGHFYGSTAQGSRLKAQGKKKIEMERTRKKMWSRAVLLLLVVPVSVVLNAFRIWITGVLTVKGYEELAQSFFHDFSGWLIFMLATGLLVGAAFILNRIGSKPKEKQIDDPGGRSMGLVRPIALTAIICLLFISSGWALKQIPSAENLPQRIAFKSFPEQIGEWSGKKSYLSKDILESLWADDYLSATFSKNDSRNLIYLFIPFYEYQGTRHTAHAPQSCLLGGGWALLNSRERVVQFKADDPIKIMTMTLEKGDAKVLGSYFFFQRGRVITSPWLNKFYLMWDAFKKRRTDGALVRVEMVLAPNQTVEEAWKELESFIAKLWPILPDYVPL
jgi:EpsI family protein